MDRSESERLFFLTGTSSSHWRDSALGLKHAATVLRDSLIDSMKVPPIVRQTETQGLVMSSMLLLGMATENLIKAVYIAKNPDIVNREKVDGTFWKADGGHGIASFANDLVELDSDEEELLHRLQEHIVWAGRYPIPKKSSRFHDSLHPVNKRRLHTKDFRVADRLFEKLIRVLDEARRASA